MPFGKTLRALSDPVRRDILTALRSGEQNAGEIVQRFAMTGAAISYHLNQLKKADLIYERRVKNYIYYGLNTTVLDELILWLEQFKKVNRYEADSDALLSTDVSALGPNTVGPNYNA